MTQNPMNPPMDWYPDPADPSRERYWDGERWTHNTRPMKAAPMGRPTQNGMHAPFQLQQPQGNPSDGSQAQGSGRPGQDQYGQNQYGQNQYGQNQYGQNQYGQNQYGQPMAPQQYHQGGVMMDPRSLTADGVPLAGWWVRVFAMLLDSLICGLLSSLLAFRSTARIAHAVQAYLDDAMSKGQAGQQVPTATTGDLLAMLGPYGLGAHDMLVITLTSVVLSLLYSLLLLRFRGATLGQTILGIRVVPTGQGQAPRGLGWGRSLRRVAVFGLLNNGTNLPLVGPLLLLLSVVSYLMPLGHPRRQTLHDLAAGTQVVRTR